MALLEPVVLLDEVEVVAADNNGVLHLVGNHNTPIKLVLVINEPVYY